jgi:hypothetical protein
MLHFARFFPHLTPLRRSANITLQCPVAEGNHDITHTVALPKDIPPGAKTTHCSLSLLSLLVHHAGRFTVNVRGYTVDEDDMLCLDLVMDFRHAR